LVVLLEELRLSIRFSFQFFTINPRAPPYKSDEEVILISLRSKFANKEQVEVNSKKPRIIK